MSSEEKKSSKIDLEQKELLENAQRRIRQKKRLMTHFVVFIAGAILFILLNLVLGYGKEVKFLNTDWFVWAILLWFFFFLIHLINVFFVNKLMGKAWEQRQLEKLVEKQYAKIEKLKQRVEKEHPLPKESTITPPELGNENSINS